MKFIALLPLAFLMLPLFGAGCSGTEVPIAENGNAGSANENTSGKSSTNQAGMTSAAAGKSSSSENGGTAPTEPNNAAAGQPDTSTAGAPSDPPTEATFQCGPDMKCNKTQLCVGLVGGISPDQYQCQDYPNQCKNDHSCACVQRDVCAVCNESAGGVVQECQIG